MWAPFIVKCFGDQSFAAVLLWLIERKLMQILVVSGSHRASGKSGLVGEHVERVTRRECEDCNVKYMSLVDYSDLLYHYHEDRGSKIDERIEQQKRNLLTELYSSDGIVVISPEWGGMMTPLITNMMLLTARGSAGGFPLAHKPGLAIGVSEGSGGCYPISMLRGFASKNSQVCWLPFHVVIQNVDEFLAHEWSPGNENRFSVVQSRLLSSVKALRIYAMQLKPVRENLLTLSELHPYGQ